MKFEPLFKSENNKLVRIQTSEIYDTESLHIVYDENIMSAELSADNHKITAVFVKWSTVELEPGSYNEEFLAALRDFLKKLEENNRFAFIIPTTEKDLSDSDTVQEYIDAMVHCARRIKDCTSVIGFSIPNELLCKDNFFDENSYTQWFINEMSKKHSHYLYFVPANLIAERSLDSALRSSELVTYVK